MPLIGRKDAQYELERLCESNKPEFLVVYGRRRVGKTYLIREYFGHSFAFYATGVAGGKARAQLKAFNEKLKEYGCQREPAKDWWEAFSQLRDIIDSEDVVRDEASGKIVVFIDEMPWLDAPRTDFLTAFEWFWNGWASGKEDLLFIACGSATSWIVNKLLENVGGLYNRVTARIYLEPFTLGECEAYYHSNGIMLSRQQILEYYMVFGGIPYYMDLMHRRLGVPQNVDRLCFARSGPLRNEFNELYRSLFRSADGHIAIVRALATKRMGLTRDEVADASGLANNGTLTRVLAELEQCAFVRSYRPFGKKSHGTLYQLIDPFSLFYLQFMEHGASESYWQENYQSPRLNAWRGYAFELVCLLHVRQIRQALGIAVISATYSSWRSRESDPGAQVDLVIDRADQIIDLCEMKWAMGEYTITKEYSMKLRGRVEAFSRETKTRKATHTVMITPNGLAHNPYRFDVQAEVTAEELFT